MSVFFLWCAGVIHCALFRVEASAIEIVGRSPGGECFSIGSAVSSVGARVASVASKLANSPQVHARSGSSPVLRCPRSCNLSVLHSTLASAFLPSAVSRLGTFASRSVSVAFSVTSSAPSSLYLLLAVSSVYRTRSVSASLSPVLGPAFSSSPAAAPTSSVRGASSSCPTSSLLRSAPSTCRYLSSAVLFVSRSRAGLGIFSSPVSVPSPFRPRSLFRAPGQQAWEDEQSGSRLQAVPKKRVSHSRTRTRRSVWMKRKPKKQFKVRLTAKVSCSRVAV